MKRVGRFGTVVLILALVAAACGDGGEADDGGGQTGGTFVVGGTFALTGPGAAYGEAMSSGLRLGVQAVNEQGGAGGVSLETNFLDMKGEARDATVATERLISEGVEWVSTHLTAPPLAQAPIAEREKLLLMNGAGNSPELREASPYLLNNVFLIDDEQKVLFNWATDNLGIGSAGILRGLSYSEGALASARETFEALGVNVVAEESHPFGASDLKAQLETILAEDPDAIYLLNDASDELLAIRQAYELGFRGVLLSSYNLLPEIASLPSEMLANLYTPGPLFEPSADFLEAHQEEFGADTDPSFFEANFYTHALILAEALNFLQEQGEEFTGESIREAILEIRTFPSATGGELAFSDDGTIRNAIDVFQVEDGSWVSKAHIPLEEVEEIIASV
ncbi:MAG: ABC transporter substrate-binding protein [bacterium]